MNRHPSLAFAAVSLLALFTRVEAAQAQPAPGASTAPAQNGAAPGGTWGAGIPGAPPSYPASPPGYGPGAVPPGAPPQGGYPQGAYPPGAYAPGTYPQGAYPPPGNGPWSPPGGEPTMLGADGRIHSLPLEMPYDADKGIPPGYRLAEKPRYNLALAGGITFGSLWVISCVAGGFMEDSANSNNYYGNPNSNHAWPMYIPVVGPWITIATDHTSASGTTALLFDGAFQAAGAVMFIVGMNSSQKILKYQFQGGEVAFRPSIAPLQGGGFAGVSATF